MATRERFRLSQDERRRRTFSEGFKKQKVLEIERKQITVSELSREYQVRANSIYRWIKKYGTLQKEKVRLIVEMESDTKKIIYLQQKVAELERLVGQKQVLIDFMEKVIDLAEDEYGIDIKKKSEKWPSFISGKTGRNSQ